MNILFIISALSLILLGSTPTTATTQIEKDADKFIIGITLAKDCLRKLKASIDLFQTDSQNATQTEATSPDILMRDCNIYTTICDLCDEFASPTLTNERKGEIFDHLAVLTYSHLLIPNTIIDQKTKKTIFENLGLKRSDAGNYFIQCLVYNPETSRFILTQSRNSNPAITTFITYEAKLNLFMHRIQNADQIFQNYKEVLQLITNFAARIQCYEWGVEQEKWVKLPLEIFTTLRQDLLAISSPLYLFNTQIHDILETCQQQSERAESANKLYALMNNTFSNRFKEIIDTVKVKDQSKIENLRSDINITSLISDRIKLYTNAIQKLKKNQSDFSPSDNTHSYYIDRLGQHLNFYTEIKKLFNSFKLAQYEDEKRAIADRLFIQFSMCLLQTQNDDLCEAFYIQPIIDHLKPYISNEAELFTDIINEKLEIIFNDDWKDKFNLQKAKFISMPNSHLLAEAEEIVALNTEIESVYRQLTQSWNTIVIEHTSLSSLFQALKPEIAKYKKNISEKINRLERLMNKISPSSKKKKRAKKKSRHSSHLDAGEDLKDFVSEHAGTPVDANNQTQISESAVLMTDVTSTSDQKTEYTNAVSGNDALTPTSLVLTKTQLRKLKKEAKRLQNEKPLISEQIVTTEKENLTVAPPALLTETTIVTGSENSIHQQSQWQKERERKAKLRANIERQRRIEQEKAEAELAALADQKRQKEFEKKKRMQTDNKFDHSSNAVSVAEEATRIPDSNASQSHERKPAFKFNPNAPEFKPQTTRNTRGEESQQTITVQPVYNADYVAWMAAQQAWHQHFALIGYPVYGYPLAPNYTTN